MSRLDASARGTQSQFQGELGELWVRTAAAAAGFLQSSSPKPDREKADVEITFDGELDGTLYPTVKVQVKTDTSLKRDPSKPMTYDLDVETYNVLRMDNHDTSRALVVIGLCDDAHVSKCHDEGFLLKGDARWVNLHGKSSTSNTSTIAVSLAPGNVLDHAGILRLLETRGRPRSTPVENEEEEAW